MATGINNLVSYDLKGVKESFANWISNISPTDTPFVSMTGKESIQNKYFQWQSDSLGTVGANAHAEGSDAESATHTPTEIQKNVTQILRKVVQVSDTADALSSYGRGSELAYQMEKAGAEIKRDLEHAFLTQGDVDEGTKATTATPPAAQNVDSQARKTAGFKGLVDDGDVETVDGANLKVVLTQVQADIPTGVKAGEYGFKEDQLFTLTSNLYEVGAAPNIIMFHPSHAKIFSGLMENGLTAGSRQRMFDGADDTKINTYVATIVDPLGQEFKLIPNRFMPKNAIYIFDPSDWTQMVLRAPQRTKLAKTGSFEKWMIEMEVGLRHRNPHASGILNLIAKA